MSEIEEIKRSKWSFAVLLLSQCFLLGGCEAPEDLDDNVADSGDIDDSGDEGVQLRAWTEFTSEETPPIECRHKQAVQGFDCYGGYCDDVALYCRNTGRNTRTSTWVPYFSEEGTGPADEGRCVGDDVWMTGVSCRGDYCDDLTLRCTQIQGTSTGSCQWSGWYSEEEAPFYAPSQHYIKAIECDGAYCDDKRFRYCRMYN